MYMYILHTNLINTSLWHTSMWSPASEQTLILHNILVILCMVNNMNAHTCIILLCATVDSDPEIKALQTLKVLF